MRHTKAIGRLGGLAIGLGIGAALAASPGIASAAPDIDISFDGMDVFHTPGHTAEAFSGMNDFAIASGTDSIARAGSGVGPNGPGQFDFASASGTDSLAQAGFGNFDTALANGDGSMVGAGGDSATVLGNSDFASALGANTLASAGSLTSIPSSNDVAEVFDPFGTAGSGATIGDGNFDFLQIFGDALHLTLGGGPGLFDIFGLL